MDMRMHNKKPIICHTFSTKIDDKIGGTHVGDPWVWNTSRSPICGSGQGYSAFGLSSAYRPHSGRAGAAGQGVSSAYGLRHPSSLGWSNRGVICFFGICSASFVNHARQEASEMNVSGKLFPMLESSTQ